jgi:hypothetical protein
MAQMENVVSAQARPEHLTHLTHSRRLPGMLSLAVFGAVADCAFRIGSACVTPCGARDLTGKGTQPEKKMESFIHRHVDQLLWTSAEMLLEEQPPGPNFTPLPLKCSP